MKTSVVVQDAARFQTRPQACVASDAPAACGQPGQSRAGAAAGSSGGVRPGSGDRGLHRPGHREIKGPDVGKPAHLDCGPDNLVAACVAGDQQAWHTMVERFSPLVWTIARSHRLSPADCQDVYQLTWMRVVQHLHQLRSPDRLAAWFTTTARRESLKQIELSRWHVPVGDSALLDSAPHHDRPTSSTTSTGALRPPSGRHPGPGLGVERSQFRATRAGSLPHLGEVLRPVAREALTAGQMPPEKAQPGLGWRTNPPRPWKAARTVARAPRANWPMMAWRSCRMVTATGWETSATYLSGQEHRERPVPPRQ